MINDNDVWQKCQITKYEGTVMPHTTDRQDEHQRNLNPHPKEH